MNADRQRLRLALLRGFAVVSSPARHKRTRALTTPARILLIRPDHIGDLLFATPALRLLREALPDAHLACLVGPWGEPVLESNPHLDELIVCDFPGFTRQRKASLWAPYWTLWQWAQRLRSSSFDLAIVLRFDHWWGALLAYVAGIPHRVGYDVPECKPFLTEAVAYTSGRHEVLQNLALADRAAQRAGARALLGEPNAEPRFPMGAPTAKAQSAFWERLAPAEFHMRPGDEQHIERYLRARGVTAEEELIAIHPGAGAAVKLWQTESWAHVADSLLQRPRRRVVITGSQSELDLAWSVYARMASDAIVAAGTTTLGQLAALFSRCRLVVGPDSGPLHLAVAIGTPTLHLYGPVDARKFGPWGDPQQHVVLTSDRDCIPCNRLDYPPEELPGHPCVREISVKAVLDAAEVLLSAA